MLDVLSDTSLDSRLLLVTPYLRPFNDPAFGAVGEVVDFIEQTLEVSGCVWSWGFRTEHVLIRAYVLCIATEWHIGLSSFRTADVVLTTDPHHSDCAAANIMMDGSPLYPQGHHPVRLDYTPDGVYDAPYLSRMDNPVKYYFIDFGISTQFREGDPPYVLGTKGRDKSVPELSDTVPYNPFLLDIYVLGHLYQQEFLLVGRMRVPTQVTLTYHLHRSTTGWISFRPSYRRCYSQLLSTVQWLRLLCSCFEASRLSSTMYRSGGVFDLIVSPFLSVWCMMQLLQPGRVSTASSA